MMYHALFDMEDFHGLHPVKREDGYYLEFSGHTALDQRITKFTFKEFLEKWYEMRQKCLPNSSDTPEEKAAREKEYALWKGEYPQNVARETAERMRDILKEQRLQAELDELYITYKYPSSQYHYFENLQSSWGEIVYIEERKPWWAEWEINALEEKFRSRITGENDVFFSEQYDDKEME